MTQSNANDKDITQILHKEGCSCVVENKEIRTFHKRGIDDLYSLLNDEPQVLSGASVADRIVGKAAAALMVTGGVKSVYADLISVSALMLLRKAGIKTDYGEVVTYIKNSRLTDWCPVEAMCYNEKSIDDIMRVINHFEANKESYFKKPDEGDGADKEPTNKEKMT